MNAVQFGVIEAEMITSSLGATHLFSRMCGISVTDWVVICRKDSWPQQQSLQTLTACTMFGNTILDQALLLISDCKHRWETILGLMPVSKNAQPRLNSKSASLVEDKSCKKL